MTKQYPDKIYFKIATGKTSGYCRILNIHDGLIFVEMKRDHREHIIPFKSLIELIRNAYGDKQ